MRKSQKLERKWTYCFYQIDLKKNAATAAKDSKTSQYSLRSGRPIKKVFERSFFESANETTKVKILSINQEDKLLVVPTANITKQDQRFICCFKLRDDDLLMVEEVIGVYTEAENQGSQRSKIVKNIGYKSLLDGGLMFSQKDLEQFNTLKEGEERQRMISKWKVQKMLLILDSGVISAYTVKLKDCISLGSEAHPIEVEMNNSGKVGLSESTKFLFNLKYTAGKILGTHSRLTLTLGTESEAQRREWAFSLELAAIRGSQQT